MRGIKRERERERRGKNEETVYRREMSEERWRKRKGTERK